MTDLSDLERKMLECDHKCAEHEQRGQETMDLKKCVAHNKKNINKISNKLSWITGFLFLIALIIGYCFNSIAGLTDISRIQSGQNQTYKDAARQVEQLTISQNSTRVLIAQIKSDMQYMKLDLSEIKRILNKREN